MDNRQKQEKIEWLKKEHHQLVEKRRRRYFHFDIILDRISPSVFARVTNSKYVSRHAFMPLLRRVIKERLYKKDPISGKKLIVPKERPISYAAHFDALIYSWYAYQLEADYEAALERDGISDVVIAYRKLGKSNLDFAKEVFRHIENQESCVAIGVDISDFYGSLDHRMLKRAWSHLLGRTDLPDDHFNVFKSITRASTVSIEKMCQVLGIKEHEREKMKLFLGIDILDTLRKDDAIEVNASGKGIPQGTPISCVLSNAYMREFDIAMRSAVVRVNGLYRRYSDDIMIVCPIESHQELMTLLNEEIRKINLVIQPSKTEVRIFKKISEGGHQCEDENGKALFLQYLGVLFDGQIMSLRHKGRAKFGRKLTRAVRRETRRAHDLKRPVARSRVYEKFTSMGAHNYVAYAIRAARELGTPSIRRSVSVHRLVRKIKERIQSEKRKLS